MIKISAAIVILLMTFAHGQSVWTLENPLPTKSNMLGITYGDSQFVMVGEDSAVLTSPDGLNWTLRNSGSAWILGSVVFGDSQFVAVGQLGSIFTSPDGINWTARQSGTPALLNNVAFGANRFVVVMQGGAILTSPDGATWASNNSGISKPLFSVTFGDTQFVATGQDGAVLTSPDGINWTPRNSGTTAYLYAVTYGAGQFVAVGSSTSSAVGDTSSIFTSPDGINWTPRNAGKSALFFAVTYGAGQFVAVGETSAILTSPDGINWTSRYSPGIYTIFSSVAFGKSRFLVSDDGNMFTSYQDGAGIIVGSVARGFSLRLTNSELFASYPGFSGWPVHAMIFTARGNMVMQTWGQGDGISLPVGGLARGVYTVEIASGKERASSRFVKQ